LIAPISIWLAWRDRTYWALFKPMQWWPGVLVFFAAALVWAAGYFTATPSVLQGGAVFALIGSLVFWLGRELAIKLWFPILFLLFMLPFGGAWTPYLTEWTADFVEVFIRALGIPVYREAADFVLPTGRWSVIAACSGLRYVLSAMCLAALFAYLNFASWKKGILFFAVATLSSIFANWIRAALTVYAGHLTHMRFGPGEEHVWFGWIVFGLTMFAVCRFSLRWADSEETIQKRRFGDSVVSNSNIVKMTNPLISQPFALLSYGIIAASVLFISTKSDLHKPSEAIQAELKKQLEGTRVTRVPYLPELKGYQALELRRSLMSPDVHFATAYFANQPNTASMISFVNSVLPDEEKTDWRLIENVSLQNLIPTATSTMNELPQARAVLVKKGVEVYRVIFWYQIGASSVAGGYRGKLLTLKQILSGVGDHGLLTVVVLPASTEGNKPVSNQEVAVIAKVYSAVRNAATAESRKSGLVSLN
jgi:exosortase